MCDLEDSSTIFYLILGLKILCGKRIGDRTKEHLWVQLPRKSINKGRGIVGSKRGRCFHLINKKLMMQTRSNKILNDDPLFVACVVMA